MRTPRATRRRGYTNAMRRGTALLSPTRYHTGETATGRDGVPLVIEGTIHYTTAEAADELGLTQAAVKYAIKRGTLDHVQVHARLNMVPAPSVEAYRRTHLGRQGRPKGARNKPKGATTAPADNLSAAGKERDQ